MEKDFENIMRNLVRVGTVSSVNVEGRKARVLYKDKGNLTSGWLPVLQHYDADIYIKPDNEHSHSGAVSTQPNHDHTRSNVTYWMPKVGDTVLALYIPVFDGDGFILGGI